MLKNGTFRTILTGAVVLGLFLFLASCGGGGGDSGAIAGKSGSITLTVDVTSIPADGSSAATITAVITDSAGNPVRHFTDVTFSTTLGHFRNGGSVYTVQTQPPLDANGWPNIAAAPTGIVQTALIAGNTSGVARVTVNSNQVTQTIYITLTGQSAAITLAVNPASIPADGFSSSTITAILTNNTGAPVTPGTPVTFTTTLGAFAVPAQKTDMVGEFSNGGQTYTVFTPDATGIVQVSLIAGTIPGSALITAESNGVSQSVYVGFGGNPVSITLTANPAKILADGISSSSIKAVLTDATGAPVRAGTEVTFNTGLGSFPNGGKTYTTKTLDTSGAVSVALIAGYVPGSTYVSATSNFVSQSTTVVLSNNFKSNLFLTANPLFIPADGKSTSLVTATVTTTAGTPIKDVPITFYDAETSNVPTPLPDDNTWKGDGSNLHVTPDFYSYSGTATFTFTYRGSEISNFSVELYNRDTGKQDSTLVNVTGPLTSEVVTRTLGAGNYFFRVTAEGTWEIKVAGSIGPAQVGDPIVLQVSRTDGSGKAYYIYTSTTIPGEYSIKAETGESTTSDNKESLSQIVTITQTGGSSEAITVTAGKSSLYANGADSTTIQARVLIGGNLSPDGTEVKFFTDRGTIEPSATTVNGIASVKLTSSYSASSLIATVTTIAQGLSGNTTVTFVGISLTDISADPTVIVANGVDKSTISVRLRNDSGAGIENETILFSTTNGTLSSTVDLTDKTGVATVELIAPILVGSGTVTAKYGAATQSVTVTFATSPEVEVGSIALTANPARIPGDGASTSTITAAIKDTLGKAIPKGTEVTFTTTLGTFPNGTATHKTVTPDETGMVSVALRAGTTSGSALVIVSSRSVTQAVYIGIGTGPINITLVAEPTSIPANGSSSSIITATLKDSVGQAVYPGTSVTFTTTLGRFSNNQTSYIVSTIDNTGVVSVSLISETTPGTATVTATSNSVSQSVAVEFTGGAQDVGSVEVFANPSSIPADGASTSVITATVKTQDNQVIEGVAVAFKTSLGAITSPHTTGENGQAVATLTSARIVDNNVQVTATCQGKSATTIVAFTGVTLTVTANPTSLLAGGTSNITATLMDAAGNPIPNATVTLVTDKGTLSQTQTITNGAGQVYGTLTSAASGAATVTASGNGATGSTVVTFTRYLFTVAPDKTTIRAGGETSRITATLLDEGVPKTGQPINFGATLGTLEVYQKNTGTDGKAVVTLTSGTQSGVAVIDAFTQITDVSPPVTLSSSTQVVITGGTATKIVLTADPDIVSTNTGVSAIKAAVYDANDQPVPNQDIYFRINYGPGGGEYLSAGIKVTNSFGVATVNFIAGSLPSALKNVQVEANTASDFSGAFGLANLTIAGPVANIGVGMNLETLEPVGGSLQIDVVGIATDVNGNPVADGTKVFFAVTAVEFNEDRAHDLTIDCWDSSGNPLDPCPPKGTPGFGFTWFSDDVNQDGTMFTLGGPMSTTEDVNNNGILDPGEDKNDNGVIDPIQGCTIEGTVLTVNGLADATLIYPAPQAWNIRVKITAEAGGISNFYQTILLCTQAMVNNGTCGIAY